ncbi:MAG: hypothetical protein OXH00_21370 [Candidatus Poribacteria bacterium]|nr:hypothetical protein [Candidatus Poribacteria bacterium]
MRKRKRKSERKFLLSDKSFLRMLSPEQREQLDSKHKSVYPPILLVENAQHGLGKPSALLNFKNTIRVPHWVERAKMELLIGPPPRYYKVGAKVPIKSIYNASGEAREKIEKGAVGIVNQMEAEADRLKKHVPILPGRDVKLTALTENHKSISDKDLLRLFNQALREYSHNHPQSPCSPVPIGIGNTKIPEIRKFLDECKAICKVDTLGKAYKWIAQIFYEDSESVLDFLCNGGIIPVSADEQSEIFNRFRSEGEPPISSFAPYALITMKLYHTMFLYLTENRENSSPREVLRDFDYLFYALDDYVIFVSAEKWHKKCIEEIPLLKNVRKNFVFITHKNKSEEEYKKGLKSIGIKM